ncbi:MAG: hypothetical protein ABIK79_16810 [Chloroflexota bacterium]|nr:hypothetical protein [Anaerolineae bacterium]
MFKPDLVSQPVEATYEGDVLRLHRALPLDKHQRVLVVVVPIPEPTPPTRETPSPDEILQLAAQVYDGLSPDDVDEIERLALDRSRFFARRK